MRQALVRCEKDSDEIVGELRGYDRMFQRAVGETIIEALKNNTFGLKDLVDDAMPDGMTLNFDGPGDKPPQAEEEKKRKKESEDDVDEDEEDEEDEDSEEEEASDPQPEAPEETQESAA